jgi:two-component system NtrC family sensor kinase
MGNSLTSALRAWWPFRARGEEASGSGTTGPTNQPQRILRLLVVASLLLPAAVLGVGSAISYRQHIHDAESRVERANGRLYEHALKVFETFELSAQYLDELLYRVTDDQLRVSEAKFNAHLRALTNTLPQLRDLWVIGADGRPIVSGTIYPMPDIDLSDRQYFRVHKNNEVHGVYISELLDARAADLRFFALSRKRLDQYGQFNGVTTISIAPEYFTKYYSEIPSGEIGTAALLREDGAVLARHPEPLRPFIRLPPTGSFMTAILTAPEGGSFRGPSAVDGTDRLFSYRKLPRHGIYVVTGIDSSTITKDWLQAMSSHLAFGIPATLAMFALATVALRRTQRESFAYEKLQQEVARREKTEQALRQAQKMEAVGRLTGGIAHDFNNLLTAILGNVDMALRRIKTDDERIRRSLTAARQASERAATLVQRLLAFSRQHPQEIKSVDINRLVQGISELLRRTIGETVTIETVLGGGLWRAAVDPNQLENAILNLAVNSRDAMPEGGRLTVETANTYLDEAYAAAHAEEFTHGQYVMVAVTDTGSGMSKEVVEHAFEPFFTTKGAGVGTGLGLSMVYGFVKQSDGHIKIYTEIGEGTTIKLYFPRLAEKSELAEWPSPEADQLNVVESVRGETILLVEDDEEVNRFGAEVLREHGYRVLTAYDGASGLQLLKDHPKIALLFTDVVLPRGMNGRQLADEALRLRPKLPVLFATGYTRNAIIHQGRLDPDVELLTKPFTPDALARKVRQLLGEPLALDVEQSSGEREVAAGGRSTS